MVLPPCVLELPSNKLLLLSLLPVVPSLFTLKPSVPALLSVVSDNDKKSSVVKTSRTLKASLCGLDMIIGCSYGILLGILKPVKGLTPYSFCIASPRT